MKKISQILPLIYCTAFFVFSLGAAIAESHRPSQSNSTTASLNFKIHIPETIYLQIGTVVQKQDGDASGDNPVKKTGTVSPDKKNRNIKTSGLISRGGMIFLSTCSSNVINGLHGNTTCYILSSP